MLSTEDLEAAFNNLSQSNYFKNILKSFIGYINKSGDEVVITSLVNSSLHRSLY